MATRIFQALVNITVKNDDAKTPKEMKFTKDDLILALQDNVRVDILDDADFDLPDYNEIATVSIAWNSLKL